MPLDQVPMVATHNSFNTEEEGVSTPWEVSLYLNGIDSKFRTGTAEIIRKGDKCMIGKLVVIKTHIYIPPRGYPREKRTIAGFSGGGACVRACVRLAHNLRGKSLNPISSFPFQHNRFLECTEKNN